MGTIKRKSFLKRSSVRKKRLGPPRRGRVVDVDFIEWMHQTQPCLVFTALINTVRIPERRCQGRLTVHHVRECGSPKNDRRTIKLCEAHHLIGSDQGASIERLGKTAFEKRHGVNIEAAITEYNRQYERMVNYSFEA